MNIPDAVIQEQRQGLLILYNITDLHETTTSAERPSDSPLHKLISTEILIHFFITVEGRKYKKSVFQWNKSKTQPAASRELFFI